MAAVDVQGFIQHLRCKVAGEGERQAQCSGHLRAIKAAAQDIELHMCTRAGCRDYAGLAIIGKIALQFHHVAREGVRVAVQCPADRCGNALVASGGAAQSKVYPARVKRVQCAKLFGNDQWRMVGQHDAA